MRPSWEWAKRLLKTIAVLAILWPITAHAQNQQCRTAPVGTSTANCASEAFVTNSVAASGDVHGPASSVAGHVATFADTTGKLLADGGLYVKTVTRQVFTASGTYTPSTGMLYAVIECLGGGGAGGGAALAAATAGQYGGGGGGNGSYSRVYVSAATIGASKTVTIGAAGASGSAGANNGGNGGDTSVGSLCIGKGGQGGRFGSAAQFGIGGTGGVAGTGDVAAVGAAGGSGPYSVTSPGTNVYIASGSGASSVFGGGGLGQFNGAGAAAGTAGMAGSGYGSGGSGGLAQSPNTAGAAINVAGGAGAPGLAVVTEYLSQ